MPTRYAPSSTSMWKWILRLSTEPKRWISVTAPVAPRTGRCGPRHGAFDESWAALEKLHALGSRCRLHDKAGRARTPLRLRKPTRRYSRYMGCRDRRRSSASPSAWSAGVGARHHQALHDHVPNRGNPPSVMCAFSKMVVRKDRRLRVYACTLVDDNDTYDLGSTLAESMPKRVTLQHHRCSSCFKDGSSCSEIDR